MAQGRTDIANGANFARILVASLGVLVSSVGVSIVIYTGIMQPYTIDRTTNRVQRELRAAINRHEAVGGHDSYMTREGGEFILDQLRRIEANLDRLTGE